MQRIELKGTLRAVQTDHLNTRFTSVKIQTDGRTVYVEDNWHLKLIGVNNREDGHYYELRDPLGFLRLKLDAKIVPDAGFADSLEYTILEYNPWKLKFISFTDGWLKCAVTYLDAVVASYEELLPGKTNEQAKERASELFIEYTTRIRGADISNPGADWPS